VPVSGNSTYISDPYTPTSAGTYHRVVSYSGDASNDETSTSCGDTTETTVISPAHPALTTVASSEVTIGGAIRDRDVEWRAHPTGTILFEAYGPGNSDCGGGAIFTSTVSVSGNGTYDSAEFTPGYGPYDSTCSGTPIFTTATIVNGNGVYNSQRYAPMAAGTYRWTASDSGDAHNRPTGPTGCMDAAEQVQVTAPADPQLTTSASDAVALGSAIHDTAHLSGGSQPTGTITFNAYGPDSSTCTGTPIFTSTATVAGNND
jgi:hypothetical protein